MQVQPAATCPDDGLLARFIERSLDAQVADRMRDHLDDCDTCRRGVMQWVRRSRSQPLTVPMIAARLDPLLATDELDLGHFLLRRRLGAGGMGVVYAAFDTRLEREVAIKLLASAGDPRASRMLLDEARAQARIAHPSVVTVYEVGEVDGVRFIAMELIRGRTLRSHLAAHRPDVETTLALYARAAAGLAAAHALGVIHRDFKPDNVLVEEDPTTGAAVRVVVSDFGLAAITDASSLGHPHRAPAAGTPGYMAPEQHEGRGIDQRADVYSFAVALWESLYDALPSAVPPVPPPQPEVPAAVRAWLVQALAIDPARRPASISSALVALAPPPPRRRGSWLVGAAASIALVGAAGTWALSPSTARDVVEVCHAELDAWHHVVPWDVRAAGAGVPAWVRARVANAMTTRERDVATRGATACASPRPAARKAWTACRAEQAIIERETLAALALPWPSYARLDDALELPWVSTCTTRAAELSLVLAPATDEARRDLDAARATLAKIELAWQAGYPRADWEPQLAAMDASAIKIQHRLLEAAVAHEVDGRKPLPLLEAAVADAERTGDLVGAAHAWLGVARLRRGDGASATAATFEQAGWAIERIGDPPALRAAWHASMTGLAWARSDIPAALDHARKAAALEEVGGASRHRALAALASAAGASAQFQQQRNALEALLEEAGVPTFDHVQTWSMYAESLYHLGEPADALHAIERSLAIADQLLLREDPVYAQSLLIRSFIELDLARTDACLATIAEVERLLPRVARPDDELVGATLNIKASALAVRHDWHSALAAAEAAAAFFTRTRSARDFSALFARQQIGELAKQAGDRRRSETEFRAVLDDARAVFGVDDPRTAAIETGLGSLLLETGRAGEARPLLEHAVATYRTAEIDPAEAAQPAASLVEILRASSATTDRARARELAIEVREAWRDAPYWREELAAFERVLRSDRRDAERDRVAVRRAE